MSAHRIVRRCGEDPPRSASSETPRPSPCAPAPRPLCGGTCSRRAHGHRVGGIRETEITEHTGRMSDSSLPGPTSASSPGRRRPPATTVLSQAASTHCLGCAALRDRRPWRGAVLDYRFGESRRHPPVPRLDECGRDAHASAAGHHRCEVTFLLTPPPLARRSRRDFLISLPAVPSRSMRWRWRESNPRPRVTNQVFSGRSWLGVLSAPALAPARCRQAQTQFISLLSPEPTLSR